MLSTSHLRELTAAASRVFGWDNASQQVTHNQLIITQEQLQRMRELCDKTPEEDEDASRRLMTPEGQEELRRKIRELLGREQNIEQPNLPPTPAGPEIYEVTIRGRWRRSEDKAMNDNVTTALQELAPVAPNETRSCVRWHGTRATSNENKMSDGGRGRAALGMKVWKSS